MSVCVCGSGGGRRGSCVMVCVSVCVVVCVVVCVSVVWVFPVVGGTGEGGEFLFFLEVCGL